MCYVLTVVVLIVEIIKSILNYKSYCIKLLLLYRKMKGGAYKVTDQQPRWISMEKKVARKNRMQMILLLMMMVDLLLKRGKRKNIFSLTR